MFLELNTIIGGAGLIACLVGLACHWSGLKAGLKSMWNR